MDHRRPGRSTERRRPRIGKMFRGVDDKRSEWNRKNRRDAVYGKHQVAHSIRIRAENRGVTQSTRLPLASGLPDEKQLLVQPGRFTRSAGAGISRKRSFLKVRNDRHLGKQHFHAVTARRLRTHRRIQLYSGSAPRQANHRARSNDQRP